MPPISPNHAAQELASRYMRVWADTVPGAHFIYIEGFPDDGTVERLRALPPAASAILIEEDPASVGRLRDALEVLGREGVSIVEANMADATPALLEQTTGAEHVLVHFDPPAPGMLSLDSIRALASIPATDFWIRFPQEDLHKLARFRGSTLADLTPYARRILEGYSGLLGDTQHGWAAEWWKLQADICASAGERLVVERFRDTLLQVGGGRSLKLVSLELAAKASVYLFCMTSDPMRALALNAVVEAAGLDDQVRWSAERFRRLRPTPPPVAEPLDFFATPDIAPFNAAERELDEAALAEAIISHFLGRTVSIGEVAIKLLVSDVLPDDVRRALRLLRRGGRARYMSLKSGDAEVDFPPSPIALPTRARVATLGTLDLLPEGSRRE